MVVLVACRELVERSRSKSVLLGVSLFPPTPCAVAGRLQFPSSESLQPSMDLNAMLLSESFWLYLSAR